MRDFGGSGQAVLLLHGLAGHADEWRETASWLTAEARVLALDARGHGHSEPFPVDVSHRARVDDVVFVVEALGVGPVALVGQSVGGLTALSVAARHTWLVRSLVLVEASPPDGSGGGSLAVEVAAGLRRWPLPFESRESATSFFRMRFRSETAAQAWADGLEQTAGGWRPRFDIDVIERTLRAELSESTWTEWEQVRCPTLVVRGERGTLTPEMADKMLTRLPGAQLVGIADAGHDVHLDQPEGWATTLQTFLRQLR